MREALTFLGDANGKAWHHRAMRHGMRAPHRHDELEANLVVDGRAGYVIDGRRVPIVPDDLLFLHPDQDHLLVDESADFRMWVVVWRPRQVEELCAAGLDSAAGAAAPVGMQLRRLEADTARRLARLFADVASQGAGAERTGIAYLLWRTRSDFVEATAADRILANPVCTRAARLLREDPAQTVAAVAMQIGLTEDHLERIFRRETGLGLAAYRTRLRLTRALDLWDGGARDLTALALDSGFGSYSAFNRAFRGRYGRAPREYLQQAAVDDGVVKPRRGADRRSRPSRG